ncbi:hypothetical protein Fmac_019084 [Flemingia macrophylla]|uniref:Uncharacterized protein n=1 Tax=Flemingia macrophylla TaxID=520843 RepID=A0ABD1M7H1_9FABA
MAYPHVDCLPSRILPSSSCLCLSSSVSPLLCRKIFPTSPSPPPPPPLDFLDCVTGRNAVTLDLDAFKNLQHRTKIVVATLHHFLLGDGQVRRAKKALATMLHKDATAKATERSHAPLAGAKALPRPPPTPSVGPWLAIGPPPSHGFRQSHSRTCGPSHRRQFPWGVWDLAVVSVKSHIVGDKADFSTHFTDNLLIANIGLGRDLSEDHDEDGLGASGSCSRHASRKVRGGRRRGLRYGTIDDLAHLRLRQQSGVKNISLTPPRYIPSPPAPPVQPPVQPPPPPRDGATTDPRAGAALSTPADSVAPLPKHLCAFSTPHGRAPPTGAPPSTLPRTTPPPTSAPVQPLHLPTNGAHPTLVVIWFGNETCPTLLNDMGQQWARLTSLGHIDCPTSFERKALKRAISRRLRVLELSVFEEAILGSERSSSRVCSKRSSSARQGAQVEVPEPSVFEEVILGRQGIRAEYVGRGCPRLVKVSKLSVSGRASELGECRISLTLDSTRPPSRVSVQEVSPSARKASEPGEQPTRLILGSARPPN